MTVRSEPTQVLTTVCHHGRPMAVRLYSPDDPEAQDWWDEERHAIPGNWSVELWPRDADFTFCEHCLSLSRLE